MIDGGGCRRRGRLQQHAPLGLARHPLILSQFPNENPAQTAAECVFDLRADVVRRIESISAPGIYGPEDDRSRRLRRRRFRFRFRHSIITTPITRDDDFIDQFGVRPDESGIAFVTSVGGYAHDEFGRRTAGPDESLHGVFHHVHGRVVVVAIGGGGRGGLSDHHVVGHDVYAIQNRAYIRRQVLPGVQGHGREEAGAVQAVGRLRQEGEVGCPLLDGSYPLEIEIDPVQSLVST